MSASEDMSHPGYWGGIILVGKDVFVDVKSVRKRAMEHVINESTQKIRNSVTMDDNRLDLDGNSTLIFFKSFLYFMCFVLYSNSASFLHGP